MSTNQPQQVSAVPNGAWVDLAKSFQVNKYVVIFDQFVPRGFISAIDIFVSQRDSQAATTLACVVGIFLPLLLCFNCFADHFLFQYCEITFAKLNGTHFEGRPVFTIGRDMRIIVNTLVGLHSSALELTIYPNGSPEAAVYSPVIVMAGPSGSSPAPPSSTMTMAEAVAIPVPLTHEQPSAVPINSNYPPEIQYKTQNETVRVMTVIVPPNVFPGSTFTVQTPIGSTVSVSESM